MSEQNDYTSIVLSVLGGMFLLISEVLPFIKNVKSNGVCHLVFNTIKTLIDKYPETNEREPLLGAMAPYIHESEQTIIPVPINQDPDILDKNMNNLNNQLLSISNILSVCVNDIQNTRQLKLQPSELYELNYIINYIKVNYPKKMFQTRFLSKSNKQLLISQGYIVDYDSQNDTNTIKW